MTSGNVRNCGFRLQMTLTRGAFGARMSLLVT